MSGRIIKISVLTPTIRGKGLEIMQQCLKRQTMQDFEWLVEVGYTGKYDINAAFNRMIRRAKGELLVFYEDYGKIMDDGIERFWKAYQEHPDTLFTAPLGKVDNLVDSVEKPRWDWRATKQKVEQTDYTNCLPRCWEIDWACAPKKALYDVGGFDEEFDKHFSGDNVSVGVRAEMKGWKFACLFTNPAIVFDHDKYKYNPNRELFNGTFIADRCLAYQAGLTINFL